MPGGRTHAETQRPNGKRGRPSSLSDKTKQIVRARILNCATYSEAAIASGIHPATFQRWLEKGGKDFEADRRSDYRDFYELVQTANNDIKAILRGRIINSRDPRMALRILERRWPDEWGLKVKVEEIRKTPTRSPRDRLLARFAQIEERQQRATAALEAMQQDEKDLASRE